MGYDYYDDAGGVGNMTGSGGMPCPGSNGATLEQLMIVNDLGTIFGLVLQNVFAISGILGKKKKADNSTRRRAGKVHISMCSLFQPTQWRSPS